MARSSCDVTHPLRCQSDAHALAQAALDEGLAQLADPEAPRERQASILLIWLVARLQGAHDLATAADLWSAMQQAGSVVFCGVRLRFNADGPAPPISVESGHETR